MKKKYELAARMTIQMVLRIIEKRKGWTENEAVSRLSKCPLYARLGNVSTKLWMDNPIDLADMFERELRGEQLTLADFFK